MKRHIQQRQDEEEDQEYDARNEEIDHDSAKEKRKTHKPKNAYVASKKKIQKRGKSSATKRQVLIKLRILKRIRVTHVPAV